MKRAEFKPGDLVWFSRGAWRQPGIVIEDPITGPVLVEEVSSGEAIHVSAERVWKREPTKPLPVRAEPITVVPGTSRGIGDASNIGRTFARRPHRDAEHLAFVRTLACAWCSAPAPSDAHHMGGHRGTGTKASDYRAIPLCRACHGRYHATAKIGAMTPTLTREWGDTTIIAVLSLRLDRLRGSP